MKEDSPLTISIIVPVYNGGTNFSRCLDGLDKLQPPPLEILVVADGCTDNSSQKAQQAGYEVLEITGPCGPAQARNQGASQAKGDILFFVDSDVLLPSHTIKKVMEHFIHHPELAALIGSYDHDPGHSGLLSQYRNLLHHYTHQQGCCQASTFWGACGAIRAELFQEHGGFDPKYRAPSVEDIELGYRLKANNLMISLDKSLQVKHLKTWTPMAMLSTDIFKRAMPWTELILDSRQALNDLNVDTNNRTSIILTFSLFIALIFGLKLTVAFWAALSFAIALIILNVPFYSFLINKRGLAFTLNCIPWHWLYFSSCGIGFLLGACKYALLKTLKTDSVRT